MPNTTYSFAAVAGQTIAFDAATDVLSFGAGVSASALLLSQVGSTVVVTMGSSSVTLSGMTLDKLRTGALTFADGSQVLIGDGLATTSQDSGANTLTGGDGSDYLNGLSGNDTLNGGKGADTIVTGTGTDTVNAGEGDDRINLDGDLAAADKVDGGAGIDEVHLNGSYSSLTFSATTLTNVEKLILDGDLNAASARTYKLTTADATVADGAALLVDGSALDAADTMNFDGTAELSGAFQLVGGAGADVLKGGAGGDTIVGGAGNDLIVGGQGADVLTGGSGVDTFSFARGTSRSDSSPTTMDRITDFEGAGAVGGDLIQLPVPNGGKPLAFAGYKNFALGGGQQAPNAGDGFADVFYDRVGGQTRIAVDVNDDGLITEVDQVILLDGNLTLQAEDFDAAFSIVRGTENADTILGSAYGEQINALGGDDNVSGLGGADTIYGGAGNDTIDGGVGADKLYGEADADTIRGGDDNDTIDGGAGDDTLHGDAGGDTITGGTGVDTIDGGQGADTIDGGDGADVIHGGSENDSIKGGNDADQLHGDAGDDTIEGGAGDDQIDGGADNDTAKGGAGTDTIHGGTGNDTIYGDEGNTADGVIDYLYGDEGNDTLYAGSGRDVLSGGTGADRFVVTNGTSSAAYPNRITDFSVAEGDKLQLSISGSKPLAWFGNKPFFFDGTFGNGGVQFPLAGDGLADAIWDYDAATDTTRVAVDVNDDGVFSTGDLLLYLTGQHSLTADSFAETFSVIRGGAGDDVMPGTANADTYYGMGGNDQLSGEAGADTLYGGDGDDLIDGGAQSDALYGEAGDDTLIGGEGADTASGGAGYDQLYGGDGNDNMSGGTEGDQLYGGLGDDTLYGNEGQDLLVGDDGADSLRGGDGDDTLGGGIGNDDLEGDGGNDILSGDDGNDTIDGGAGNDAIAGGDGNDTIAGNDGADTVDAGSGDDILIVGTLDVVTGAAGADKFNFYYNVNTSIASAAARVTDFAQGSDRIDIAGYYGTALKFVFNGGDRQLGTLVASGQNQTILGNGGDGLADVLYTTSADGLTTYLILDTNDDGKLDVADLVVAFSGDIDFLSTDFTPGMFKVMRGSDAADALAGTDGDDTIYGVGGNDLISGLAGADTLLGQAGDDTIDGGLGEDTIYGGDGNDTVSGGDGATRDYLYGENGDDEIRGGEGNDVITGGAGRDTLYGDAGDDTIDGNAGVDQLYGGDGNDTLRGGDDDDNVEGGIGNDTIEGNAGNDTLMGGEGNDGIDGGAGTDTLLGEGGNDTLTGGADADVMDGGAGTDALFMGALDTVTGGADADKFKLYYDVNASQFATQARVTDFQQGTDTIEFAGYYGTGLKFVFNQGDRQFGALAVAGPNQTILGNAGDGLADIFYTTSADGTKTHLILDVNDDGKLDAGDTVVSIDGDVDFTEASFAPGTFTVMRGTPGADTLTGTANADTIYGVDGNDTINGLDGGDSLYGQGGDDTIDGGLGQDTIEGGDGNDTLLGGTGNFLDYLYGGNGNDSLDGGDGNDQLFGHAGNDTIVGGLGDDTLDGAAGTDILDGGEGTDTLRGGADNDVLNGGLGNDSLDGGDGVDTLHGNEGNDTIDAGAGDDQVFGDDGNDTINGNAGADTIDGGAGDDTITLGRNDMVTGGAGADKFRLYYDAETSVLGDVARITDFQQGTDKLEVLGYYGSSRLLVVNPTPIAPGLALNGAMPFGGDAFSDIVFSHETGPNGPVTRVFIDTNDNGKLDAADTVFELAGHVFLTADDFTTASFSAVRGTPDNDTMTGTAGDDDIYGVAGNDTIHGRAGGDDLYGQDGNDTLHGEEGNDALYGGAGDDTLYGGIGTDTLTGGDGADTLEGDDGNDTLTGGVGNDVLRGGFGGDTLNGNEGEDTLEGGADNDTLNGGDGDDILLGQDGADTITGGNGDDTVQGGALADTITGGAGNDTVDGGTEIDTAVFGGKISEYEIVAENGGITVRNIKAGGTDGTDFLTNVEKLQFSDGTIQGSFLTVSDGVIVEGDGGQKMMAFTVSLFGNPTTPVTVNYATTNGTAASGTDYVAKTGSLSFAVGETSKTVYVAVNGDALNEVDETFSLTLNNANGASIADGVGQGTILNDDAAVSIADAQIVEGQSGTKTLTFTLTLDKPAVGPVSVGYKTVGGSATEGVDYVGAAGFVQFAAGESSKPITITINGDTMAELDESFIIQLLSATGARIGDGSATATILNDDENHAPTPVNDSFTIDYQTALETTPAALLANDSDPDGQPLTLLSVQDASHGTVALVDGRILFTPASGYSGPASFTYTVSDGTGGTATATVNVTVAAPPPPPNTPPASVADAYAVAEDATLNVGAPAGVLANDSDVDGNPLTVTLVTGPQHGTLTLNPDGSFVYKPVANYNGPDSFTYVANDGTANGTPTTVTLNVTPVNDAPAATADGYATNEDSSLVVDAANGVLANDSDIDGNAITAQLVTGPAHGTLTLNADGSFSYTPAANYSGTDSFTYRANDGTANAAPVTVTLTVKPENDAPAAKADSYTVAEDGALTVGGTGVLANDSDAEGSPLTAQLVTGPAHGTLTLNPNGSFSYTPAANYNGPDSFTYRASDGTTTSAPVTVTLNVTAVNDAPVATGESYAATEDNVLVVPAANGLLKNDSDIDGQALTAQLVTGPAHGSLTLNADGSFTYTPAANYNGPDSFIYRASDGTTTSAPVTVTLNVAAVNDAPDAVNDSVTTPHDTPLVQSVAALLANDGDVDGDAVTLVSVQNAVNGTVSLVNGVVTFTPLGGFSGAASYSYTVSDGHGGTDTATVNVLVSLPNNSAPVATADNYAATEDTALVVSAANGVLKNDSDVDGNTLTAQLVTGPAHGTLTLNPNGSFSYTPAANYNGTDSFTYLASDGTTTSAPVTVTLNVAAVNDAPVATADNYAATEDTALVVSAANGVLKNDIDVDGNALTAQLVTGPAHGTLTLNPDGSFNYTPAANYNGTDSFTYRATDGTTTSAPVTVTLNVAPVNDAPVANADNYAATEDTAPVVSAANGVLKNDSDVDGNTLTAQLVTGPAHGTLTLNPNGSFSYTPAANYNGTDSFTYRASDGTTTSAPVTVTLNVAAVNDAPVAMGETYAATEDTALVVSAANGVLKNDTDVDGNTLTAQLVTGPAHGTLTLNADGSFSYTPAANYNGPDSFTYRASDGTTTSAPVTVTLNVAAVNDAPDAAGESFSTGYQTPLVKSVAQLLGNETDADGDTLSIISVQNAVNGTVALVNGVITFTPSAGFSGLASYSYTVSDGHGGTDTATVSITVGSGGGSDDLFFSSAAAETFDGGAGSDTVSFANVDSAVKVSLALGGAQSTGGGGVDTLVSIENLVGSAFNDTLTGDAGDNRLEGGAGDDTIAAGDGNDVLDGGSGVDRLTGGAGDDTYYVDEGKDRIVELAGGGLDSVVTTVASHVLADNVEVLRYTGAGDFTGTGNAEDNSIYGGAGNDRLYGRDGADQLFGGDGNDMLNGGTGIDRLTGGAGDDTYYVDDALDKAIELAGGGTDTVIATASSYTLGGNIEVLRFTGTGDFSGTGNAGDNKIQGGDGNDRLSGLDGSDALSGGAGDDVLIGGRGADRMAGGIGDDSYYVDDAGDSILEAAGEGYDHVYTSVSHTLSANLEELRFQGTAAINGTGNALANKIVANDAANVLDGGAGDDSVSGRGGDDLIYGGAGNDAVQGDDGNDQLFGGSGNDTLRGGAGSDLLAGGGGQDLLFGGAGADIFRIVQSDLAPAAGGLPVIADFLHADGDQIDLSAIDANGALAGDSFSWIGSGAFTGAAGELRFQASGADLIVSGDLNGDKVADFSFTVAATATLDASDFAL